MRNILLVATFAIAALIALPADAQLCKGCNDDHDCYTKDTSPAYVNCSSNGTICRTWTFCTVKDPLDPIAASEPSQLPPCRIAPERELRLYAVHIAPAPRRTQALRLVAVAVPAAVSATEH